MTLLQAITKELKDVYQFRGVIPCFVFSTFKARYRRSRLGYFWAIVSPLIQFSTLGIVFSWILHLMTPDFVIYFMSGIVLFNFIGGVLSVSPEVFLSNEVFIKKIYIPKTIFALLFVCSELLNLALTLVPLLILGVVLHKIQLDWHYLYLLVPVTSAFFMLVGVSLIVGSISVHFRDMRHIFPAITLGLFYGTPILYPREIIPSKLQFMVSFNPFYYFVECFRTPILTQQFPSLNHTLIVLAFSVTMLGLGLVTLVKQGNRIVYKL